MAKSQQSPTATGGYGPSVSLVGADLARVASAYPDALIEFPQSGTAVLHRVPPPVECKAGFAEKNAHGLWVIAGTHFAWVTERNDDGTESDRGRWSNRYHA